MPKEDVLQKQKKVEVQKMPEQQFLEDQEQSTLLQGFLPDEKQLDFEQQLQEQKEFLATSQDVENLRTLNTYMANRSQQAWAQNYDEYAQLAGQLNQRFRTQYYYDTKHSNWAELEQQARDTLAQVMERDAQQQKIKENTSFAGIDETIDAILKDRNIFTDSGMYRGIRETCEKYKAEKVSLKKRLAILEELQGKVRTYTELRYKKDGYSTKKGARRMEWMTKLLAMISGVQGSMLPEIAEFAERMSENAEQRSRTKEDMDKYLVDEKNAIAQTKTKITSDRYVDLMLYYERDKNGEVTEATRANYEENLDVLHKLGNGDFTRENQEKRISAIVKIYQRLKQFFITEDEFTVDKAKEWFRKRLDTKGFTTVYNTFNDLVTDERDRYRAHNVPVDERIQYMVSQSSSQLQMYFSIMTEAMLVRMGMNSAGRLDSKQSKKKIKSMENDLQGELDAYLEMSRQEMAKGDYDQLPDAALEERLRDYDPDWWANDTMDAFDEEHMQKLSQNKEYMDALSKQASENKQKIDKNMDFVIADLKDQYGDYFSLTGLQKMGVPAYWRNAQVSRVWNALDPYEKDAEGNVTPETLANYQQNEKIMKLLFSPDAEDRIAVLAKMYLRLGKVFTDGMPITEASILQAYNLNVTTNTMSSARNVLDDMLRNELVRDANNELVKYMKWISGSKVESNILQLGDFLQGERGYQQNGTPLKGTEAEIENYKMVQRMTKEGILEGLKEEIELEKQENGGRIITIIPAMEERLKELCRKKGLNFD